MAKKVYHFDDTRPLSKCNEVLPRVRRHAQKTESGPRVFVYGRLVLDRVLSLLCLMQFLADAVLQEQEKIACEWSMTKRVGGFPAWAIRAVRKMGGRVWLSTVFPLPMPKEFLEFFDAWDVDTSHCITFPGRPAATVHFSCKDGHRLLTRPGVEKLVAPSLPTGIFHDFDLVLAKPGAHRTQFLKGLHDARPPQTEAPPVAIVLSRDYTAEDLNLLCNEPTFYLFCNSDEAISIAEALSGNAGMSVEQAAAFIKSKLGTTRLCISLGRDGAMLLNGETHICRGTPVDGKDTTGAGDRLATLTASEIAVGVPEVEALDRAVTAVAAELAT